MLKAKVTFTPRDIGQFIADKIKPGIVAGVAAAQSVIVQEAQAICPVRTGALRDSITAEDPVDDGSAVTGQVSANMSYAGYVEFGTGIRGAASPGAGPYPYSSTWPGMVAQPYLRPALDTARQSVRGAMASAVRDSLKS